TQPRCAIHRTSGGGTRCRQDHRLGHPGEGGLLMRNMLIVFIAAGLATSAAMAAEVPSFQIIARDGHLIPATLQITAGQRVKLLFRNEGPGPEEFEIAEMRIEKVLAPGAESFAVLPPRKSGDRIRLFGEFHLDSAECIITVK